MWWVDFAITFPNIWIYKKGFFETLEVLNYLPLIYIDVKLPKSDSTLFENCACTLYSDCSFKGDIYALWIFPAFARLLRFITFLFILLLSMSNKVTLWATKRGMYFKSNSNLCTIHVKLNKQYFVTFPILNFTWT